MSAKTLDKYYPIPYNISNLERGDDMKIEKWQRWHNLVVLETQETGETEERTFIFTTPEDAASATELLMWLTEYSTHDGVVYQSEIKP